jgi:hypothetical protein
MKKIINKMEDVINAVAKYRCFLSFVPLIGLVIVFTFDEVVKQNLLILIQSFIQGISIYVLILLLC